MFSGVCSTPSVVAVPGNVPGSLLEMEFSMLLVGSGTIEALTAILKSDLSLLNGLGGRGCLLLSILSLDIYNMYVSLRWY